MSPERIVGGDRGGLGAPEPSHCEVQPVRHLSTTAGGCRREQYARALGALGQATGNGRSGPFTAVLPPRHRGRIRV